MELQEAHPPAVVAAPATPATIDLAPEKEAGALQAGLAEISWTAAPREGTDLLAWSWQEEWRQVVG